MILVILLALVVLIGGSVALGAHRWSDQTAALHRSMLAASGQPAGEVYDERQLADLPAPVQRYFRSVLKPGQPLIARAHITQEGSFLVREDPARWGAFEATQLITVLPPGFYWDARIAWGPGMRVNVRDAYTGGGGLMRAMMHGVIKLVDQRGTPELAEGELMRYLAETPLYPTALLPGQGVTWEAVDDSTARATLTDGTTTATLDFHFNEDGLIAGVSTQARYRDVNGIAVPTPWRGRFRRYEVHSKIRVPTEGQVAWVTPSGVTPYWRGRTVSIRYDLSEAAVAEGVRAVR